jgi:rRNA processing protein Gar1
MKMIDWRNINTLFVFLLCGNAASVFAASEPEMAWFKNEMVCAGTKVIVRSYCKNEADEPVNSFCTKQGLILENLNKRKMIDNLLDKEPSRNDFHVVGLIRCVMGANEKPYLYVSLDNGGNCDNCEISAIMDLNGKWKRYDKHWYVSGAERKEISRRENDWFRQKSFLLKNKIED